MEQESKLSKNMETGEDEGVQRVHVGGDLVYDQETGELNSGEGWKTMEVSGMNLGKKFHIPKWYLHPDVSAQDPNSDHHTKNKKCYLTDSRDIFTLSDKEKVINLKEEIILGYNKTSHRLFLIPSLFLFFRTTAMLLILVEILLHIWAHHKNSKNTNPTLYYRSPMFVISSQFCAICRSELNMNHVSKIQDKRLKMHQLSQFQLTRTIA